MPDILKLFEQACTLCASDMFLVAGAPVTMKIAGVLTPFGEKLYPDATLQYLQEIYTRAGRSMDTLLQTGDDDFSFSVPGMARFRVNAFRQRGSLAGVVRIVSFSIPDWQEFGIPAQVMELSTLKYGMVLFTGTAGSGKSTTEACLIDRINKTRNCHIITMEDPIEYLHRNDKSIVSQREISIDTENCVSALRACLRQAPDVIQIGEMRDLETIRAAMTAAETGHLLFGTLHTRGCVNAIDRIVDSFPSLSQQQIRVQLSMVLQTVVSQQLLPGVNGRPVPAFEIMHMNTAIRSLIREGKTHQINNAIATGTREGMITMDQYLLQLTREGKITAETALLYADDADALKRRLGG